MGERCLDREGLTTHLSLGGVVGDAINIEAVCCILGNVKECYGSALGRLVHGVWRIAWRIGAGHRIIGGAGAHHMI